METQELLNELRELQQELEEREQEARDQAEQQGEARRNSLQGNMLLGAQWGLGELERRLTDES